MREEEKAVFPLLEIENQLEYWIYPIDTWWFIQANFADIKHSRAPVLLIQMTDVVSLVLLYCLQKVRAVVQHRKPTQNPSFLVP